ncbi:hypothetical protein AAC387_Pa07g1887 [Persea americana]
MLLSLPLYEVVKEVLLGTHLQLGSCLDESVVLVEEFHQAFRRKGGGVSVTENAHDVNRFTIAIRHVSVEPL